ncbi:hypothetical protein B296_00035712 [Ensete ventricosum]|uniref:Uncharacterized protein n=1 Tax=Ensete ventricosum TaxID=4639 RepID=A0A426XYS9_ENSVE|nr:hypothetical protein B296_00035712 [Ensete ventricosum]
MATIAWPPLRVCVVPVGDASTCAAIAGAAPAGNRSRERSPLQAVALAGAAFACKRCSYGHRPRSRPPPRAVACTCYNLVASCMGLVVSCRPCSWLGCGRPPLSP